MIDILFYVLEANFYLIMFAVFYFFALRKEKSYLANRFVLISSVLLAWTIPSIRFLESVTIALPTIGLEAVTVSSDAMAETSAFMNFSVQDGLVAIYTLGVIIGSMLFVRRLFGMLAYMSQHSQKTDSALKIIETDSEEAWSFFRMVAIGKKIPAENKEWIIAHESVHVFEGHSVDKLIIQLVKIFGWFNPAVYYLELALEENHEFRADEVVCEKYSNTSVYSHVLISQAMGGFPARLLGHEFSKKSLLKSRIQMINQTKQTGKMKYLLTIPVLAVALLLHSCTEKDSSEEAVTIESKTITKFDQNTPEGVYEVVEKMPEFKGGMEKMMTFMAENTIYPQSAKDANEEGTVFVKFIIDEAGDVTKPEILEPSRVGSEALKIAAIETVSKMPAWIPGEQGGKKVKVQYVLPIQFSMK